MRTPRQIAAARANGAKSRGPKTPEGKLAAAANAAKSTGPVTPEGKARSSRNATRHALLATSLVLDGESEDRFFALLARYEDELRPETPIEFDQVEVIAVAHWRRMRKKTSSAAPPPKPMAMPKPTRETHPSPASPGPSAL